MNIYGSAALHYAGCRDPAPTKRPPPARTAPYLRLLTWDVSGDSSLGLCRSSSTERRWLSHSVEEAG